MIKKWRGNKNKDEQNISFRNKIRIENIKKKELNARLRKCIVSWDRILYCIFYFDDVVLSQKLWFFLFFKNSFLQTWTFLSLHFVNLTNSCYSHSMSHPHVSLSAKHSLIYWKFWRHYHLSQARVSNIPTIWFNEIIFLCDMLITAGTSK